MNPDTCTWMLDQVGANLDEYTALTAFRSRAHKAAQDELVTSHGWSQVDADNARVDSPSFLICKGGPGQPMHIDIKWRKAQATVATKDGFIPTKVYDEGLMRTPPAQDASEEDWDKWAYRPLFLPREQLGAGVRDLGPNRWRAGDFGVMSGMRLHCGPAVDEDRVGYFFVLRRAGDEEYVQYRQDSPFTYLQPPTGTPDEFLRALREWTSHEPWKHWTEEDPNLAQAIETTATTVRVPRSICARCFKAPRTRRPRTRTLSKPTCLK